jgi:hypothetical protein
VTKRRLEVLRSIDLFGCVPTILSYGPMNHVKIYTVRSLTELVDSTQVINDCRRVRWLARSTEPWIHQMTGTQLASYVLTPIGRFVAEHERVPDKREHYELMTPTQRATADRTGRYNRR